jgi:hypothetical protein
VDSVVSGYELVAGFCELDDELRSADAKVLAGLLFSSTVYFVQYCNKFNEVL